MKLIWFVTVVDLTGICKKREIKGLNAFWEKKKISVQLNCKNFQSFFNQFLSSFSNVINNPIAFTR